ncbi:LAFA_0E00518g1_1 [Lachancea sp. 'fantastica']|nr:LAFA_0E00518g1_1 [Lachancea sp. 'fantastica']
MASDYAEESGFKEPISANKADQFHKILEKLDSLEQQVVSVASSVQKKVGRRPRHGTAKKKSRKSTSRVTRSPDDNKMADISMPRITSLDLLVSALPQDNKEPNQDNATGKSKLSAAGITGNSARKSESSDVSESGLTGDFGVILSYSVLSPRGLQWIKSKSVHCDEEIDYLSKWYSRFLRGKDSDTLFPAPLGLKPLPETEVLETLIEIFNQSGLETLSFIPADTVSAIFKNFLEGGLHSLNRSHSITLHVAFALVSHFQQHFYKTQVEGIPRRVLGLVQNNAKLRELEDIFISNALFNYHQVSILPEGIDTLQSFLALMAYADVTGALHASYMMVTLAVRLAQHLGLHAETSYEGLPFDESNKRRKIWGVCRHFDLKVSLILGKPPVVAHYDTTAIFGSECTPVELLADASFGAASSPPTCRSEFARNMFSFVMKEVGFDVFGGYYICRNNFIASCIYSDLYAPSATMNVAKHFRSAKALLKEMEVFRLSLPVGMRPFDPPISQTLTELVRCSDLPAAMTRLYIYSVQFGFFTNLIFIQRAMFKTQMYMKEMGLSRQTPIYEGVRTARAMLTYALAISELSLASYFKSFQWSVNLAFFEIFVYTLSKQENQVAFEADVKLMACVYCDFISCSHFLDTGSSPGTQDSATEKEGSRKSHFATTDFSSNFKYLINVLRKTYSSKFDRDVMLTDKQLESLKYVTNFYPEPEAENGRQVSLNPFLMDSMDLVASDTLHFLI